MVSFHFKEVLLTRGGGTEFLGGAQDKNRAFCMLPLEISQQVFYKAAISTLHLGKVETTASPAPPSLLTENEYSRGTDEETKLLLGKSSITVDCILKLKMYRHVLVHLVSFLFS